MGLDYTDGCVNFRDTGTFINLISDNKKLIEAKLLRGGSIDFVKEPEEIGNAKSIINLRNSPDSKSFDSDYFHFPMSNKIEKYDTSQKEVKIWLNQILKIFEDPNLKFPVLIHCLSGKDRTGIVISSLLLILKIDESIIKEEYLLSDGNVKEEWIDLAIGGMREVEKYFDRVELNKIRKNLNKEIILVG